MDPQVAWDSMILAVIEKDLDSASRYAKSLVNWLDQGGFPPIALPDLDKAADEPDSPAYLLNRLIVSIVCAEVGTDS